MLNTHAKYLLLLCGCSFLLTLGGCRPRSVLSIREMREVLYDLHRADGAIQVAGYNYSHEEELSSCYQSVLDKHGLTQAQFDSSLVWYTDHPQIFNKVYPKVVERLEKEAEEMAVLADIGKQQTIKLSEEVEEATEQSQQGLSTDDMLHQCLYGLDNPWHIWEPVEFNDTAVLYPQRSVESCVSAGLD